MPQAKRIFLVDTNVILRYLLDDHPDLSSRARNFMDSVSNGNKEIFILESVFTECIFVLEKFYKIPREKITETMIQFLNLKGVVNANTDILMNALLRYRDHNIPIVDCILAANSSRQKPVASFDKHMKKLKAFREKL